MAAKVTIDIGGKPYEIPPFTIKVLRKTNAIAAQLVTQQGGERLDADAALDLIVELLLVWFSKPYPDLTKDFIEENMTVEEMQAVVPAIQPAMERSGTTGSGESPAAAAPSGPAAQPSTNSSTPSSPSLSPQDAQPATGS